jgi:hypothetical protein
MLALVLVAASASAQTPIVTDIADQTISEGGIFTTINLDDYVSDIDNDDSQISWSYSGTTDLIVDISSRVATITIPNTDWNGAETIMFTATDPGLLADSNAAVFTVSAVNDAPIILGIPDQTIAEGSTFTTINLDDYVNDVDNDDSQISWSYSGTTDLTVDISSRVATITIPDTDWNGAETIMFTATDPGLLADSNAALFTVSAVNDAPIVTDIADQTIPEGSTFTTINLDDYVSDIDNDDSQMSWSYSGTTDLTVDITARVATITSPNTDWNGTETVMFTATDPGLLADSNAVVFTVSAVNDAPVVIDIADQTISEGGIFTTINLDDFVSDIDNDDSQISWSYSGTTDLTVDITARVATITMPDIDWNGAETIMFTATDPGLLADSNAAVFTVSAVNDAPIISGIPDQTIAEGSTFTTINLDDFVSDIDNDDSQISWSYSGTTDLTVDITARVATITSPGTDWNGAETIMFTATDPGLLADSNAALFTVSAVNDAPVVTDIADQTIPEGSTFTTINLDDFVSDIDNADSDISWSYSGTTDLTVDISSRVATITIPNTDWNGAETIMFTATDPGLLADSNAAVFTVNAVNDAPIMTDIPDQTISEGSTFATINLDDYVSDIDNLDSEISWSFSGTTDLIVDISSRVATITMPDIDWNGAETIMFTATDPGLLADSNAAVFTVSAVNDAPIVTDIADQTISEGGIFTTINLDDFVSDIDNDDSQISWSYSGTTDLIVDISSRVATITIPDTDWNGAETIMFTATDPGLLADSNAALFTVSAVNDAPIVTDIADQTIPEGSTFTTINLDDFVSDIDNADSQISWSYSGTTDLTVDITARVATITSPGTDWNGTETIMFTATDPGLLADSNAALFTVSAVNDAPIVTDIADQTISEGSTFTTINLDDFVSDIDNADSQISWSYSGTTDLTVDITARVATITSPGTDWNGAETIMFTATDPGLLADSNAAAFTVSAVNDAPIMTDIPDQTISEGSTFTTINLDDFVSDIDNADSQISWSYSGTTDLTVDISSRVATITIPNTDWNGAETIMFTATDPGLLADSNAALFTVSAVNDAPIVSGIPDQTIDEGSTFTTINLDDFVSDIDNADSQISWSYSGTTDLLIDITARVATITIPDTDWNGAETIMFTATDLGLLADSNAAVFTVSAVNDAPVVTDIADQTIDEGSTFTTINLDDFVNDVDNADAELSWTKIGNSELLVDITNRIATIIVPGPNWNGSETITFTATDPYTLSHSDPVLFTVSAVNDAPVVTDIPDQTIAEGSTFTTINLDDYVSDIDGLDTEMSWSYSGTTDLTVDISSRIATITSPDTDWNGTETIMFTATDPGLLADSNAAVFTVSAVNDAPIVTDIPDQTIDEGFTFTIINLDDFVSDIDNDDSQISWSYSGTIDLTVDVTARVATITIPDTDWNGTETIMFRATDPGTLFDEDIATFVVNAGNDAPVVADIADQTIAEGATFVAISLDDFVSDVDNLDSEISWSYSGTTDLTVDISSRVATITSPGTEWNGSETIMFTATDPGLLADSNAAVFIVSAVNDGPIMTDIADQTIAEGSTFTTINLDDYVSDIDNLDSDISWSYSGTTDLTVSIVSRVATIGIPNADWNGSETIMFTATDPGTLFDSDAATFTVSAVNDAPVVSDIPDQGIAEGSSLTTINLDDYVLDVDNLDSELTWSYSGDVELSVTIDGSHVATISLPGPEWNGSETIIFRATDPDALFDEDGATYTVSADNDAPVVTDIPDQTTAEGSTFVVINLDDYVSDIDNTDAEMTWSALGNNELAVDISSRVATITIPDTDWNGAETITFMATDPGLLSGSNPATFTVTGLNDAPVMTVIPDQTIAEGATFVALNLDDYVSDIDNADSEISWAFSGTTDLTVDITARVATITAPDVNWSGTETITFTATDPGALFDADSAIFSITAVNDAPIVADIPDQTIAEGSTFATINLDDFVSDVDNADAELIWTKIGNSALLVDITNRVATIIIPGADWNGSEVITFTATDPGTLFGDNAATFTVSADNDGPVVTGIPDLTIAEGGTFTTINLDDYVSDIDNLDSEISWAYSGTTELTVDITARIVTITIPGAEWNGAETITFTATDPGSLSDWDEAVFTVSAVNDPPVVTDIPDQSIAEGALFAAVNLDHYVSDLDNIDADMSWTYSGNIDLSVDITAQIATITAPYADWNGVETITFRASDPGTLFGEDAATFTIGAANDAPVVADIPDQTIPEGSTFATLNLDDYVSDVDNADSELTWTKAGNSALLVDITNRVATIIIPNEDWNGSETITFRATDPGTLFDENVAVFTVTAGNDAPVVTDIPNQIIAEGGSFATINLDDYVSDIDNTDAEMTWSYVGDIDLTVSIDGGRVATIVLPDADWTGTESITFIATDPGTLAHSNPATFTVTAVNDAPVVSDIQDQTIAEGGSFAIINLSTYVTDVDNLFNEMTWTYSGNSALIVNIVDHVATIATPGTDWNGSEKITFRATDPGTLYDENAAIFTVTPANDAPVVAGIPDQIIAEGSTFATINLDDYVTDIDNLASDISWTYSGTTDLTVDITSRVATITIPGADWNGSETITFTATDPDLLFGSDAANFTVGAVNDAPIVTDIPDQTLLEGGSFATIILDDYVSDIDNADSEISWAYSGTIDLLVDITSRVATITAPNADWNGAETITFTATDPGTLFDIDAASFTLSAVNDAPVVADIPDQGIAEGSSLTTINLDDYVDDIDNLDSELIWSYSGTTELSVSIDGSHVATITLPSAEWNGSETITFRATDPDALFDEDGATFTVSADNDAPVVTDIPDQTIAEGSTFVVINLDDYVSDIDNLDTEITWSALGNSALSVDITNRVATIGISDADWNGTEAITFMATDLGLLSDSDPATFTVTAVNDAPVVADIPDQTIAEGASFAIINLDDFVSDVDNADNEMSWSYSGNTELTVAVASRVAIITIPGLDWNGSETIMFSVNDPGSLADSNAAVFTVSAFNDAPIVTDIPNQTIAEGATFVAITLDDFVSDIDNLDSEMSWAYSGTSVLSVDITARVATITIPSADWNGSETVTFTATDPGTLFDEDAATFTVSADNDAPVVTDIPDQIIIEGGTFVTINLDDFVSDIDDLDTDMTWTYGGNTALTVSIVSRVATIGIPDGDWNGAETITFTATDPGLQFASDAATFTVNAVNDAPVMTDIPDQTIAEGTAFVAINLDDYVSDIDNADSEISWAYTGTTDLTVDITARVATITAPDGDWNGFETITFRATDPGTLFDENAATFTVNAVNDAPVVTDIPDQAIAEGAAFVAINLDDYVSDVDNLDTEMIWTFADNTELTVDITARVATITIPGGDWNGAETITFTATDPGSESGFDAATFTVSADNDAPVVTDIPDQTIVEGSNFATINLDVYVSDLDNTDAEMVWTYNGNTELTINITNRVAIISIPNADWNGSEAITFRATDPGSLFDENIATLTVTGVNDAPVVSDIPNETIAEGSSFASINLNAFVADVDDADGEIVWTYSGNIALAVDITAQVATITPPNSDWSGMETIIFRATDLDGLYDEDGTILIITAVNDAPVATDIPDQTIAEGNSFTTINLDDYVSDVDDADAEMIWTYAGNTELTVDITARVATITIPDGEWNNTETIMFTATDPGSLADSNAATFTVTTINDNPVVTTISDQTIAEGATFVTVNLDDFVSDLDNADAEMTWTCTGTTALTVDITSRVATITIPNADWNGAETLTFRATDPGALFDETAATFTVNAVNDDPVMTDIPDQAINEGATFVAINLDDFVSDIDNTDAEMIWTFVGNTDLTVDITARVVTITIPYVDWNGSETITFRATDPGTLFDEDAATFTVSAENDTPIADAGFDQFAIAVGQLVTLDGTGSSDLDNDPLGFSWVQIGGQGILLSDATDSLPTFMPMAEDTYIFELTVNDGLASSLPDTVSVEVINVAPPAAIADLAIVINGDNVDLSWSAVLVDTLGFATSVERYVISRGTQAYFMPGPADSIGTTDALTTFFTDADLGGADVVGDTLTQYFYVVEVVDVFGNRSEVSNRVGEYDYPIATTPTTDYSLVGIPFANTGIIDADGLIAAIGAGNLATVNNFDVASQSFEARFAAGFGTNFAVVTGGIYQINATNATIFSVAGLVPAPGAVSYDIQVTPTTDYSFLMIPFEREADFATAQDLLNSIPGVLNTLNNFVAGSQSYESRFAVGFGTNFVVRAGQPYQGNAASAGVFPGL